MIIEKGNEILKETLNNEIIATEFIDFIDEIFLINDIDINTKVDLMERYAKVLKEYKKPNIEYFTPSSASACPLSLYARLKNLDKDTDETKAHQRRWQSIGNAVGDMLQEKILNAESFNKDIKFKFKRDENNNPLFEEFASKLITIDDINIFGKCDGILEYKNNNTSKDIILEIKSKQTTYSTTSINAMKSAKQEHIEQCTLYSLMYGIDTCIICYINTSKKSWNIKDEDITTYPDVRVFVVEITEEMKINLLNKLKYIKECVENNNPPTLDFKSWDFNNYKNACVELLKNDNELLERTVEYYKEISQEKRPLYIKRSIDNAYKEVVARCCM